MAAPHYEVVVVGAGPAGITAAIALAKAGIPVLVIEAGVFPGAENWSGAVYFAENLAQPDVLGEQAVRDSAWERPVTKRGAYLYNGHSLAGLAYHNPATFAHCYTVLRPTYDHYLAELAKSFGATILTETTVDGLLRDERNRIVGVHTDRGAIYADVVFLAEGDAAHLVAKEGYERCKDPGAPHFLQGIKEVIELDPAAIERNFALPRGEGAAFEIILRNGNIHNRPANLNMGGFIYTNAASISLGLVMPLDNLAREFGGDHNRLMEWFKALPEVRRWAGAGRSVAYGAKIIRGGGFRELPQLVDDGLAIGGAATGIGLDFPYPNFTGPATAMGRLFAHAVQQIRATDKNFSRARLDELYVQPLRQTHYFRNVEFLQDWPRYVEHTRIFFGRAVDASTGALYIAGHPELSAPQKLWQLAKFLRETLPPKTWPDLLADLRQQREALGLNHRLKEESASPPRPAEGEVTLNFFVDGQPQQDFLWPISSFFRNLPSALRASCDHLYRNDDAPLPIKLHNALAAARRNVGVGTYLALLGIALLIAVLVPIQWLCELIKLAITRPSPEEFLSSFFQRYRALTRQRANLDPDAVPIVQPWEEKLALIRYGSEEHTHIKVFRPEHFEDRAKIAASALWHVCPAKVYECHTDDLGQSQIIVNFENCIKCESCLRAAPDDVDWTRLGRQRLTFSAPTEANRKVVDLLICAGVPPVPAVQTNGRDARAIAVAQANGKDACTAPLAAKLREFCDSVSAEPRYLDTARVRRLQSLLDEASALAPDNQTLVRVIAHARNKKFFWAEADARQLMDAVGALDKRGPTPPRAPGAATTDERLALRAHLDKLFTKQSIKDLEHGHPLTPEQLSFLRGLASTPETLRELARKDPSLAALVSGLYPAQIAARPDLAAVPWIGLTAACTHWKDFPPMQPVTLVKVAADVCAIGRGAGEMLLERCRAHATSRVQFPGLFKDEDGRDGIAKFGAVKQLLGEMEAQCYLLGALEEFAPADAAKVKTLACEAFLSITYNAGQIFGGTAYSEDDVLSKFYRDSFCFPALLFENERGDLREFSLAAVKNRAGENPTELVTEVLKVFSTTTLVPQQTCEGLGKSILAHGYIEKSLQRPPSFNYRAALETDQHYDYGDFLTKPFDVASWRYVPEMVFADPELRAFHGQLFTYFTDQFWNRRFDGRPYHRLVEKLHMIPLPDVRDMIARGFTRIYIPKEFGGEGLLKAHYYILCPLSTRYADPSYALTIMAHSSIGTTPILLALMQDLPRAKQDLQQFLADPAQIEHLKSEIQRIFQMLDSPAALKVKDVFTALGERVKADLGKRPMLRAVAAEFLARFMDAGRAGLRMDLAKFKVKLQAALAALDTIRPRAESVVAELDRRVEACKLFLRLITAGQISAFALTEPNAGSDSGGVQTRAELKRAEVLTEADGSKYFLVGTERRTLLDAATVDITQIEYRDGGRFYCGARFHDIAQIRRDGSREFYEFYELNGAKMWITNGHVAGVMCLYARTAEGPTGFLVDGHAEGLTVGKDEEKMGQRGSPTNELSLTGVRVPRENIIGIEGRGQVNALETLNVGRVGLCVSATAMTAKVVEQTRAFAQRRGLDQQPWVQQLIGEMAMELYAVESLAYELIGRADHHGTKSVRTESAIGKYYASEVLHRVIRAAEKIHGIEGATQLHEIEKHRRDARVLNIYEGTNEVQRFLILRDLVDTVLPKWTGPDEHGLKAALQQGVETFAAQVWQNTGFQPTMFKLAEMAGYIKAMDSARWRTEWLRKNATDTDAHHLHIAEQAYDCFAAHAAREIKRLHEEFEREFALLKEGLYPPTVRAAFLVLQGHEQRNPNPSRVPPQHVVTKRMHIVVALNVAPVLSPRPRVSAGALLETVFEFDAASRTALARALEIKRAAADVVRVTALTVAPRYGVELLRRALAQGADEAVLLAIDQLPDDVLGAARLISGQVTHRGDGADQLVLCADALLAAAVAGDLGFAHLTGVEDLEISDSRFQITLTKPAATVERIGPLVLQFVAAEEALEFSTADFASALGKPLAIVDAQQMEAVPKFATRFVLPPVPAAGEKRVATPEDAAALVRKLACIDAVASTGGEGAVAGAVEMTTKTHVPTRQTAVLLATVRDLAGAAMAAECAEALRLPLQAVVFGNPDERAMRRMAAELPAEAVYFVTHPGLHDAPADGLLAALRSIWKDTLPDALIAGAWANELLARFAKTFPRVQARFNVAEISRRGDLVELVWPVFGGKVRRCAAVASVREHPLVMTIAAKDEGGGINNEMGRRIFHVPLEFEYDRATDELANLLGAASAESGVQSIADAEFIIDVGYAIRNRENFELIVTPLLKRMTEIGVKHVLVGGTRKVVEELKLLAPGQQIGQTGTAVNPRLLIALGISGAPQHIDYIGEGATIIAFNKDADAPLLTLNKRRARPMVVPIVGDLFETVPRFTAALKG